MGLYHTIYNAWTSIFFHTKSIVNLSMSKTKHNFYRLCRRSMPQLTYFLFRFILNSSLPFLSYPPSFLLTVTELEAHCPYQQIPCLVRTQLLLPRWHLLTMFSHSRRGKRAHWGLFYQDTNPIHEGSTLMT